MQYANVLIWKKDNLIFYCGIFYSAPYFQADPSRPVIGVQVIMMFKLNQQKYHGIIKKSLGPVIMKHHHK